MNSSDEPYDLTLPFIYKTIRADDLDFWEEFVEGIVWGKKQQLRTGQRKEWTVRLSRPDPVTGERILEAVKIKDREPLYSEDEKRWYSSHQSTSYAAPKKGYHP